MKNLISVGLMISLLLGTSAQAQSWKNAEKTWFFGFGKQDIIPDTKSGEPLYIAGYQNGVEITGVLDFCQARAVWLDTGEEGILLIGVDCVALDSETVGSIRQGLSDLQNCASINVYATHTHAGIDTLGLWGPVGVNGKNEKYMQSVISAAIDAGRQAYEQRKAGSMYFGFADTEDLCYDSRFPQIYDPNLYQLRMKAQDGSAGLRMFFFGAHAESLRGKNTLLSRDFPGILCDQIAVQTGDDTMFFPGAIGGLIMTDEQVYNTEINAKRNLTLTGDRVIAYALSITSETEREIQPEIAVSRCVFTVPLDNTAFLMYKFLGILGTKAVRAQSSTGYGVETELSVLKLGNLTVALIPGEIFPELVYGGEFGNANPDGVNPRTLKEIADEFGVETLLVIGLANDEIGYIVPPSDFLLNEEAPYLERIRDAKGEDHYEETNSVGPECARLVARAFYDALEAMK